MRSDDVEGVTVWSRSVMEQRHGALGQEEDKVEGGVMGASAKSEFP